MSSRLFTHSFNSFINRRLLFLIGLVVLMFLYLTFKVFELQYFEYSKYSSIAKKNVVKSIRTSPERGGIYDSDGEVIASTREIFQLILIPEKLDGFYRDRSSAIDSLFSDLSMLISLNDKERKRIKDKIITSKPFEPIVIKDELSIEETAEMSRYNTITDAISITAKRVRDYKSDQSYISFLGYVTKVSSEMLAEADYLIPSDYSGKTGVEKIYDRDLYGVPGIEKIAINSHGKIISRKLESRPKKGKDLYLTLNNEIQEYGVELLEDYKGAIVALDPNTGKILAMVSTPTFNANKFINGISYHEYNRYIKKASPLFNRNVQGMYHPASTIKPFIALGALQNSIIDPSKKLFSGDSYRPEKTKLEFREWKSGGHGYVDMKDAIVKSSDIYFYKLSEMFGIDGISESLKEFGFGSTTGVKLYSEISGIRPSRQWKEDRKGEKWYIGDTINVSIGQGNIMVTPIQLAVAISMIANGGTRYKPIYLKDDEIEIQDKVDFDNSALKIVRESLYDVVNSRSGTAHSSSRLTEYKMAGKTGTAQVISTNGKRITDNDNLPREQRDNSLFIGYAPYDNPTIAIAVIVENGGNNKKAAPIAIKIMDKYLRILNEKIEGIE